MNENNNFDYMNTMFGIQDWHSDDYEKDECMINRAIEDLKLTCRDLNAAQIKSFLITLMNEIDKRAKI